MRERKETENECRHTSWPDCLLPSHLCLCWWEDWGRRVWKSHTHSLCAMQKTLCFVCFDLSVEQIEHRGVVSRLTMILRKSHPWEPRTRAVDSATLICVCVCLSQPLLSSSYTLNTSELVNICQKAGGNEAEGWEWRRCCRLLHSSTTVRVQITEAFWHLPLLESQSWSLGIVSLKVNTLDFSSYYVRMLIKCIYITTKVRLQDSQCVCFQYKVNILDLSSCFCKECLYNMFI